MLRFWLFSLFVCSIFYLIPALFVGLVVIAVVLCGSMTLYRKKVMLNRESVIAILLNCIVDVVTYVGRFLRKMRLISEVEALRFPNYLALLLKPHPDVKYEKIQIRDDTINIIIYYPKLRKNNGAIVYVHGGKQKSLSLYIHLNILVCLKMIYTCTLYPIQWELAKNEGHSVKLQTILH